MDELFGLLQPQPQAPTTPDPQLKGEWDGFLSNPANRAAMLSFGLGLMTPTWGSPIANAMAGAAESYGGVEKIQRDEAQREQARSEARGEAEKDRQLRRDLNTEDNAAAMARTKYSADATTSRMGSSGGYSKGAQALFNRTYAQELKRIMTPNMLAPGYDPDAPPISEEEAAAQATQAAAAAADAFEARFGNGKGGGGVSSSQISPAPSGQGGNAPTGASPSAAVSGANPKVAQKGDKPTEVPDPLENLFQTYPIEQIEKVATYPKSDEFFKSMGLNRAMVQQRITQLKLRSGALNFLEQLGLGGAPGVASQGVRGPGTGQVK